MTDEPAGALAGQSVLVTGGAGFIGGHLAARLADRCDVTVLDDLSTGDREVVPDGARFVRGDVCDPATVEEAVDGADVVFHHAAMADVGRTIEAPVDGHRRNATGTVLVLDAARRADARVVFASSAAVYGQPDSLPIHETDPTSPTSPYGIDKLAADGYTRTYAEQYGLPTVALRYFNVYGPAPAGVGSRGVVRAFLDRALAGEPLTLHGGGDQTRDFVHVRDVLDATLRAAVTDATGRAYNVGTGERTTVRGVAEAVLAATGADSELVHRPPRDGDIRHSCADIGRARETLGFEPAYGFREGIRTMVGRPTATD
jgi:UDP-glucose 4-epimerase